MDQRKRIIWSELASIQFTKILNYYYIQLDNNDFNKRLKFAIDEKLNLLKEHPDMGKSFNGYPFRCVVVFQYSLFYKVNEDRIEVLVFWDNRRNPKILKILLEELH